MEINVGDFVLVYNLDRNKKLVGKITEIKDSRILIFTIYAMPEDLPMGRQAYHSKFELIRTDETGKEFKENAIKKVEVLRLQDFKQRFKCPSEAFPDLGDMNNDKLNEIDIFFFRQRYTRSAGASGQYAPDLKPSCVCRKILNPDDETIMCGNCQAFMHPICLRQNADRRCSECKQEIPIKAIYNLKRHQMEGQQANEQIEQDSDYRELKRQKLDKDSEIIATTGSSKSPFPSLANLETALKLEEYITSLKQKSDNFNSLHNITGVQKTRKNVRENFAHCLLLGVEEAKERENYISRIKGLPEDVLKQLFSTVHLIDQDQHLELCSKLATKLESSMWIFYEEQISKEYSSKYRQLLTALRNEENFDLRFGILSGEIDTMNVSELTPQQLAPRSLQEKMEQQKKRFFEEQVIMNDPMQLIVKSHKGDEIVQLNVEDRKVVQQEAMTGSLQLEREQQSKTSAVTDTQKEAEDEKQHSSSVHELTPTDQDFPKYENEKYPGLSKEDAELFEDLEKWSLSNLTKKFVDRVQQHLKASTVIREEMTQRIQELSERYKKKQEEIRSRIEGGVTLKK